MTASSLLVHPRRLASGVLLLLVSLAASACTPWESPTPSYSDVTPTPTPPPGCILGYENACFAGRTLSVADVVTIRNDYTQIGSIFPSYRTALRAALHADDPTSAFAGISDEGLALVFSTDVAYEAMPYRRADSGLTVPVSRSNPADLLAPGVGLVCDEYVILAVELFYEIYPQSQSSTVQITPIGWRTDSPVGNHAEAFATGTGVPLLFDPTWGFVEYGTLERAFAGQAFVRTPTQLAVRKVDSYSQLKVEQAFINERFKLLQTTGRYAPSSMIYDYIARDTAQNAGTRKLDYEPADFTRQVRPSPDGNFFELDAGNRILEITEQGESRLDLRSYDGIAARYAEAITDVLTTSGELDEISASGIAPVASSIFAIADGESGGAAYALADDGSLTTWRASGTQAVATGVSALAQADAGIDGVYLASEMVYRLDASGPVPIRAQVASIEHGTGAQGQGRSVFVLDQSGQLGRFDAGGVYVKLTGSGTALPDAVKAFVVGLGGDSITVLTTAGDILRGELSEVSGKVATWSDPDWYEGTPSDVFVSIELTDDSDLVLATAADGSSWTAAASAF